MRACPKVGPASSRAFMNTRVHQRIENEQIAPLRQRCQDSEICNITAAKEKRCLCPKETCSFCFETFVLLAIAAQKPRPAGTDRCTGLDRVQDSLFQARRARQREIVVRREIDPRARLEAAQPVVFFQGMQGYHIIGNFGRMDWIHSSLGQ
ncbi:DTW domain-containing protein YfiP [Bradyrhizobium sp. LB7.1]